MFDIASSVKGFAARSCSFDTIQKQIEHQSYDAALPWARMTRLRENGFLAETLIATDQGWRQAGVIMPGDVVMTFDHGHQRVTDVQTVKIDPRVIPDRKAMLMSVPKGALGNRRPMRILPMQEVIVEIDAAEELYGDPFVVIPAHMLEGYQGITKTAFDQPITVVMLGFEREQILHSNGGLLAVSNTASELSPLKSAEETGEERYHRLSQIQLRRLIGTGPKPEYAAFVESTIDDTYAALESRLA